MINDQFKSATSGHTGQLGEISKQEIESAFFDDDKKVKDKSLECVVAFLYPLNARIATDNQGRYCHYPRKGKDPQG
jgi:hypothetical protein